MLDQHKAIANISNIEIPSNVLCDKNLSPNEKLLFGVIKKLNVEKNGCSIANSVLGDFLGCGKQNISNSIASLKKHQHIFTKRKIENNFIVRYIFLCSDFKSKPIKKDQNKKPEKSNNKRVRKEISKKLRFEIFKRDNFKCTYCGATPDTNFLEIDHITPFSKNGECSKENYTTACHKCNSGKSNTLLNNNLKKIEAI